MDNIIESKKNHLTEERERGGEYRRGGGEEKGGGGGGEYRRGGEDRREGEENNEDSIHPFVYHTNPRTQSQKKDHPDYILNPKTGNYVKKDGGIGKQLLYGKNTTNSVGKICRNRTNFKINRISRQQALESPSQKTTSSTSRFKINKIPRRSSTTTTTTTTTTTSSSSSYVSSTINSKIPPPPSPPPKANTETTNNKPPPPEITNNQLEIPPEKMMSSKTTTSKTNEKNNSSSIPKICRRRYDLSQGGGRPPTRPNPLFAPSKSKKDNNITQYLSESPFKSPSKKKKSTDQIMYVYTDGAVSNNSRKSTKSVGGIGIYFGKRDSRNVSERFLERPVTNQRAELWAIIKALDIMANQGLHQQDTIRIVIYTDSMYSLNILKKKWVAKENLDIIKTGWRLIDRFPNLDLKHIRAHTKKTDIHSKGNAMADELACKGKLQKM